MRRRHAWSGRIEPLEGRIVPSVITVQNLDDSGIGSLRAAIEQADLDASADSIIFDPSLSGQIDLLSELPALSGDTTITGPGASVLTVESGFNLPGDQTAFQILTVFGKRERDCRRIVDQRRPRDLQCRHTEN